MNRPRVGTATGTTGLNVATVNGVNAANVSVSAGVNISRRARWAVWWRGTAARATATCTGARWCSTGSGCTAYIFRNVNGVWTALFAQAYSGSSTGTLNFQVVGPSLQLFFTSANNTLVAYADDSTPDVRHGGHARHRRRGDEQLHRQRPDAEPRHFAPRRACRSARPPTPSRSS